MVSKRPSEISYYEVRRIGMGAESRGWRVLEKHEDGTEIPIADFVSHRDAHEYILWKASKVSRGQ
jgi:phage-related protein